MNANRAQSQPAKPAKQEITLEQILAAAGLLSDSTTNEERLAVALRAIRW